MGLELRLLGRARERSDGRTPALYDLRHAVEVAGADFALVLGRRVAELLRGKLRFLQWRVRRHALSRVAPREVEHAVVEAVKSGERHELELVSHRPELALEARDRRAVEVTSPVERRRTVVGEHLA